MVAVDIRRRRGGLAPWVALWTISTVILVSVAISTGTALDWLAAAVAVFGEVILGGALVHQRRGRS